MEKKSRGSDSQHQPHGFLIFGLVAQMEEHLVEAQSVDSPKLSETTQG